MAILDKKVFDDVARRHASYEAARREVVKIAADAGNASKRAIFALHRDDADGADDLLEAAEGGFARVRELAAKNAGLSEEGSYRAALEEYVEASLYRAFLRDGRVGAIAGEDIDHEIYLGGLSDLTGELQRRQVRCATDGKVEEVRALKEAIGEAVEAMLALDLGGYLRTKFDQAKSNLRRSEDVLYEVTLKRT